MTLDALPQFDMDINKPRLDWHYFLIKRLIRWLNVRQWLWLAYSWAAMSHRNDHNDASFDFTLLFTFSSSFSIFSLNLLYWWIGGVKAFCCFYSDSWALSYEAIFCPHKLIYLSNSITVDLFWFLLFWFFCSILVNYFKVFNNSCNL